MLHILLLFFVSFGLCTNYTGRQDTATGTDIFIGITYAQPPIGALRLTPPLPVVADLGTLNVSGPFSNRCYELKAGLSSNSLTTSEDCLTLDIVRPAQGVSVHAPSTATTPKLLPVYVFIHGGNFNDGDKSDYDGRYLVQTSVQFGAPFIFVSINYRLSFLGFPSGDAGFWNLGLLDQRLALQWIQQSIQSFGGDPTKVVIGGHSAGANSAAYQMFANNADVNGLFRGTILHSGSATALSAIQNWNDPAYNKSHTDILYKVGCNPSDDKRTNLKCLQSLSIDTLVAGYTIVFAESGFENPISLYSPFPDADFLGSAPYVAMNASVFAKMPSMIGTTTNELVESIPIYKGIGTDAAVLQATDQNLPLTPNTTVEDLLSYYPVTSYPNVGPPLSGGQWSRAVAIENDLQIFCAANLQAVQVSAVAPVWKFRWNSVLQSLSVPQWDGVPHSSDLNYLFPYKGENMTAQSSADRDLMLSFQRYVIGFINSLNPNSLPALKTQSSVHWAQFDSEAQSQLVFQRPDTKGKSLFTEHDNVNNASCDFIHAHWWQFPI